jgi:hypothetical protein
MNRNDVSKEGKMKLKRLFFHITGILVFILILVSTLFVLRIFAIDIDGFGRVKLLYWEGRDNSQYRELFIRKHSLAKFSKIKIGMKEAEVFKLVGLPTYSYLNSTGPFWYHYKIDNGWYIDLHYSSGLLCYIRIVDNSNNRKAKLEHDESSCGFLE